MRKQLLKKVKLIVLKVGSRLVTTEEQIGKIIEHVAFLRTHHYKVVLVTSGAVGLGLKTLKMTRRPSQLPIKQALAAIGQSQLINAYAHHAQNAGFTVGQLLLTAGDLRRRDSQLNILNCLNALLDRDVLPIINENDSVATQELKVGDNDTLAAYVATLLRADLTILLTKVDGLFRTEKGEMLDRISYIKQLDAQTIAYATGSEDSLMSTGGMATKLIAGKMILESGDAMWIADGTDPEIVSKMIQGQDVGTLFYNPEKEHMSAHRRYIRFFAPLRGKLWIDLGAKDAVLKGHKSLLIVGLKAIQGSFSVGDVVELCTLDGIPFARGVCNYGFQQCAIFAANDELKLSHKGKELIHRNDLVIYES